MVGRNSGGVERNKRAVGHEVAPGGQPIMEMIGCNMAQVSQHHCQQVPGEGVFPLVQKEEYLATFAPDILLVVII